MSEESKTTNKLTISEYQQLAKRTCPDLGSKKDNELHMRLGVVTEIGEVLDIIKKNLAYKKPIDYVNLGEELADVAWYIVNWATFKNITISEEESFEIYISDKSSPFKLLFYFDINLEEEEWNFATAIDALIIIAKNYNLDFEECLYKNIEKLKIRFPDKFTEDKALNRDTDSERKVLE